MTDASPGVPWVHRHVVVKDSQIEGQGLFATEALPADVLVIRLAGRLVSSSELQRLIEQSDADPSAAYVDALTIYENAHLVLAPRSVAHFGNHSCDPNLWHVGPYEIATRQAIAAGDELTIDYGTQSSGEFSMPCRCKSVLCRGTVTGDDWRLAALQDRYRNHWVPALERRIDATRTVPTSPTMQAPSARASPRGNT